MNARRLGAPAALLLASAMSVLGPSAQAEVPVALPSEDTILFDIPVVLNVTRLAQAKSETPAAVTVIDREMIRASGVRKIVDLFRLVPGFQVGYVRGSLPAVTRHGMSDSYSRSMQVLVDGRSVYNVVIGGVYWTDLPLAIQDIERIEVIRGPNAAAYGSNAFFGVINIVTLHASQAPGTLIEAGVGEHEVRDGMVRRGWKSASGDQRLTFSYQQDDGFDNLPDSTRVPLFNFRGDYRLNARDALELQLGANGNTYGAGFNNSPTNGPRDSDITAYFQQLRWRRALGANEELSVQFFFNYWKQDQDYLTDPVDLSVLGLGVVQVPVSYDIAEERYDVELQHTLALFKDWRFVWGAGARRDGARSQPFFATDEKLVNRIYRVFGNAEWRVQPQTTVNAGTMWERNQLAGSDFSPRLALNHLLSEDHSVRLAASKATRAPTLIEEKGDNRFYYQGTLLEQQIAPSGDLKPETMRSYEVGYLAWLCERRLALDFRLYQDRIRNILSEYVRPSSTLSGSSFSYRNEGEVDVRGAEVQLDYRPNRDTRFFLSYARMRPQAGGFSGDAVSDASDQEQSVPDYSGSVLVSRRFAGQWEASAAYYQVANMDWLGDGRPMNKQNRLDTRVSRDLRLGGARGEVAVVMQNWGAPTDELPNDTTFDRRSFVVLSLKY